MVYDASITLFPRIYLWTITHFGRWADPLPLLTSWSLFSSCSGFLLVLKHVYLQFCLPLYCLFCRMPVNPSSLQSRHRSQPSEMSPLDNHLQKNIILQHLILLYTSPKWPYSQFHFLWYQGPEVKNSLNILRKEFYNKVIHKTSILLPCGAIKCLMMYTLHHFQRANHSSTQCIHAE